MKTLVLSALAALAAGPAHAAVSVAKQADKFVDTIGVNTHVTFLGSNYDAHYADWVKPRLVELGVRHVREDQGGCSATAQARLKDLAAAGIRTDLTTSSDPDTALADVKDCVAALPTAVEAVEAANERDGSWWDNAGAWAPWQQKLHDLLVGGWAGNFAPSVRLYSPPLANAASSPGTLNAAFTGSTQAARAADAAANYEYVNGHFYPGGDYPEGPGGGGYGQTFGISVNVLRNNLGSLPVVVTEWGYKQCDPQPGHPVVTQRAAAKYTPRYLLQAWNKSVKYAYVYSLLDGPGGASAMECFGLVDSASGAFKQQGVALRNTIALLKDPGTNFTPGSLDYTLSGNTANVRTALLQKRSGVFDLVLWLGAGGSTGGDGTTPPGDIEPAPQSVTVTLAAQAAKVVGYRPTFSGGSFQTSTNVSTFPASVKDEITVYEITPATGLVAAQKPPAVQGLAGTLRRTHRLP